MKSERGMVHKNRRKKVKHSSAYSRGLSHALTQERMLHDTSITYRRTTLQKKVRIEAQGRGCSDWKLEFASRFECVLASLVRSQLSS